MFQTIIVYICERFISICAPREKSVCLNGLFGYRKILLLPINSNDNYNAELRVCGGALWLAE